MARWTRGVQMMHFLSGRVSIRVKTFQNNFRSGVDQALIFKNDAQNMGHIFLHEDIFKVLVKYTSLLDSSLSS